jgi:hypothetical protein
MNDDDLDPIDALRDAWDRLEAPEASGALEDCDAETRATVAWMRDAWRSIESPAAKAPEALRNRARPRRLFLRRVSYVAAAAAILAAFLVSRSPSRDLRKPAADAPETPRVVAAKDQIQKTTVKEPVTIDSETVRSAPEVMALRSGPVRLVLVQAVETDLSE